MKRLIISGLIALFVLLALACSLTSGAPTEEIRQRVIAILGEEVEEELVQDFIVVTPPPTFTVTPTPRPCPKPISSGTYHLSVFNDQSGTVSGTFQLANGLPDGQSTRWEDGSDATRYWSYSLENVISGMITHTLVYTPDDTIASTDLYIHRERLVSVDEPGWVRVCTGLWNCSFTAEVGSVMYALSGPGGVQVDGAVIELTNGCEYGAGVEIAGVATLPPTLTPTSTPTATIESSTDDSDVPPTPELDEAPTEAPTDSATAGPPPVGASPTLAALPTLFPSPTAALPSPTVPLPSPTVALATPTVPPPPPPTVPPAPPPTDTPVPDPLPVVTFSAVSYSVAENGGSATITVVLNKVWNQTVSVPYTTIDGTAIAGSDYTASSGTLTFSPGVTSQSFNVPIQDDGNVEGNETLNVSLSIPSNAVLGSPNVATLTILDNDVPTVQFSSATYSVNESAGTATITVILNVPPVSAATVNYSTNNGTAKAGSEYAPTSGTLTFNPGITSQSFTVSIINDLVIGEGNLVANLILSNPTNATLGTPNPATLTMIDLCTLPDAITSANTDTATGDCAAGNGDDTITILLTGAINLTAVLPNLSSNIIIDGPGAGSLTIRRSSGGNYRIFTVDAGNTIVINDVTISNGLAADGAGILNNGTLTLNNTVVSSNSATSASGAIRNFGTLTINDSLIDGNTAGIGGGGITNNGTLTVNRSTISNNVANTRSGGISNESGTTTLIDSTVNNNTAITQQAGGLRNGNAAGATMRVVNSTISNNSAGDSGGGLYIWAGTVTFINSTITGNTTPTRGGGIRDDTAGAGTVVLQNTIVAGNSAGLGPDCEANNLTSQDFNLIQNTANCAIVGTTTNNITGINPLLGPLQNNGGPTDTHALSAVSPAIDAGNCPGSTADQRGFPRPVNKVPPNVADGCDIGAFEVQ